jgi:hypothetical protein
MSFERSDQLVPILNHLAHGSARLFKDRARGIPGQRRGEHPDRVLAGPVTETLLGTIDDLAAETFQTIERVLADAYVENFDHFAESLKAEWSASLAAIAGVASSEFNAEVNHYRGLGAMISDHHPETVFAQHVEKIRPKWFAEIELFCGRQHDFQAPRLFLKAGEIFGGNRAARAIFTAAKQSLDIIDTWFGPEVFDLLEVTPSSVRIRLISDKARPPTVQAYNLFKAQYSRVEFRTCDPKEIHDRFIIVDSKAALHLGASIKDLGKSDSLIDSADLDVHKKRFEELWIKGQPV